jgi:hypothetical protein
MIVLKETEIVYERGTMRTLIDTTDDYSVNTNASEQTEKGVR